MSVLPTINSNGCFIERPGIGNCFRSPTGETVYIAAIWTHGVVFKGGPACSAADLLNRYKPIGNNGEIHHG